MTKKVKLTQYEIDLLEELEKLPKGDKYVMSHGMDLLAKRLTELKLVKIITLENGLTPRSGKTKVDFKEVSLTPDGEKLAELIARGLDVE